MNRWISEREAPNNLRNQVSVRLLAERLASCGTNSNTRSAFTSQVKSSQVKSSDDEEGHQGERGPTLYLCTVLHCVGTLPLKMMLLHVSKPRDEWVA